MGFGPEVFGEAPSVELIGMSQRWGRHQDRKVTEFLDRKDDGSWVIWVSKPESSHPDFIVLPPTEMNHPFVRTPCCVFIPFIGNGVTTCEPVAERVEGPADSGGLSLPSFSALPAGPPSLSRDKDKIRRHIS